MNVVLQASRRKKEDMLNEACSCFPRRRRIYSRKKTSGFLSSQRIPPGVGLISGLNGVWLERQEVLPLARSYHDHRVFVMEGLVGSAGKLSRLSMLQYRTPVTSVATAT